MLAFADLDFSVRFRKAGRLPAFRGTTLRGALGYSLKRTVCHVHHRDCPRCVLRARCAFPAVFDGVPSPDRTILRKYPNVPQPMILRLRINEARDVVAGDSYRFGIRLFGPAIEFYPYLVVAVIEMGRKGLGTDRIPFTVEAVSDGRSLIYREVDELKIAAPVRHEVAFPKGNAHDANVRLKLDLLTPMRLRTDGQINRMPDLVDIVKTALRRLRIMNHFYGSAELVPEDVGTIVESAKGAEIVDRDLSWVEIPRRSTRQGVSMLLDGLTGRMTYDLPDGRIVPWLQAARHCHVGKAASFGFGRFECEIIDS